jgi:hypothetical protein
MSSLFAFEWRYHTRQLSYFAAAALICGTAFVLVSTRFGPANLHFNSPYVVMYSFGMLSLVGIFLVTVLSANGLLRDTEHRMSEIIFATPITRWRYLLTRFIGVVVASLAIFVVAGLVLMLAPRAIGMDPEFLGPVQPWSYGWALLVLALPNLVIATAIVFAVAATTRNTLATWVGGVAGLRTLLRHRDAGGFAAHGRHLATHGGGAGPGRDPRSLRPLRLLRTDPLLDPDGTKQPAALAHGPLSLEPGALARGRLRIFALIARRFRLRTTARQRVRPRLEPDTGLAAPTWRPAASLLPATRFPWQAIGSATRLDMR